jgi:hypothetical protein
MVMFAAETRHGHCDIQVISATSTSSSHGTLGVSWEDDASSLPSEY